MDRKAILPAEGSRTGEWRGSVVDMACKPLVINQSWLYGKHPDVTGMQESLSELLSMYPVLAGRIHDGGIACNGAGVFFECQTCSDVSIGDISRRKFPGKRFMAACDARSMQVGKSPVLNIRLSLLRDGALLNVKCSHFCADGSSFYRMMEEWAMLTRGERPGEVSCHDDGVLPGILAGSDAYRVLKAADTAGAEEIVRREGACRIGPSVMFPMLWQKITGLDRRLSVPVFIPDAEIRAVQDRVAEACGRRVGRNAVLSAMTVALLGKPMGWTGRKISMVHTADHRKRVSGLGRDYMGNASFTLPPSVISAGLPVEEIAVLAENDTRRMLSPDAEERYFGIYCAMIERKLPYLTFDINTMWCCRPTTFIINNCLKFNIYGIDFGSGAPLFAWPLDFGDPVRFWPAPPGKEGVYVYFTGRFAGAFLHAPSDSLDIGYDTVVGGKVLR